MRARLFLLVCVSTSLVGCPDAPSRPVRDGGGGSTDAGARDGGGTMLPDVPIGALCEGPDADGDGIPDLFDAASDTDGDGTPDRMDTDSDGDGILDSVEAGGCPPVDTDGDMTRDFADPDSDNDGLTDAEETVLMTDPTSVDTDGDMVSDLAEARGSMTDPTDPTSTIPAGDFFVVLPHEGDHAMRPLRFGTDIARADVYFLIDTTGSMQAAIDDVNSSLMRIASSVSSLVPDAQFGVGHYDDFPVNPYGNTSDGFPVYYTDFFGAPISCTSTVTCTIQASSTSVCDTRYNLCVEPCTSSAYCAGLVAGATCPASAPRVCSVPFARDDAPYTHDIDITGDLTAVNAALRLVVNGGNDIPESATEAIYLTASGMGLTYPNTRTGTSTIAARTCAPVAGETEPRRGYPCFRPGALPIIVHVTDAPTHNGTTATTVDWTIPYSGGVGAVAHSFDAAVAALDGIGARAIGVNVGTGAGGAAAETDLRAWATRTGTVDASGAPLVYTGAASTTADRIIAGIQSVVSGTPQDVSTRTENVAGNPDDFDATRFIKSIVPLEGYRDALSGPMPGVTYTSRDTTTFYAVIPGTEVEFTVDFWNDVRMPAPTAEIFRARIIVVGNGVADLDERQVYIVVPPADGEIVLF